jgi:prolyl-tRNA synthetase
VRRDNGAKNPISLENVEGTVKDLLETVQKDMYTRARDNYFSRLKEIKTWDEVVPTLDNKGIAVIPWCEVEACEDDIKERSGRA